jgi:hypothetical protein
MLFAELGGDTTGLGEKAIADRQFLWILGVYTRTAPATINPKDRPRFLLIGKVRLLSDQRSGHVVFALCSASTRYPAVT